MERRARRETPVVDQFVVGLRKALAFLWSPRCHIGVSRPVRVEPPVGEILPPKPGIIIDELRQAGVGEAVGERPPVKLKTGGHLLVDPDRAQKIGIEIHPRVGPVPVALDSSKPSIHHVLVSDQSGIHGDSVLARRNR